MSYDTVYVFYPDTLFEENETELKCAEQYLERFFIDDPKSLSWCNCTGKWKYLYQEYVTNTEAKLARLRSFRDFLIDDGFTERNAESFKESNEFSWHLDNYVNDDFTGFFIRETARGGMTSVWQCLNPRGFIDTVKAINSVRPGPLVTKTDQLVQSCLVAQLDSRTPAPDAFVYHGEWHTRKTMDPVTGEEMGFRPRYLHEPWEDYFWGHVEYASPNTRVTAVECHH